MAHTLARTHTHTDALVTCTASSIRLSGRGKDGSIALLPLLAACVCVDLRGGGPAASRGAPLWRVSHQKSLIAQRMHNTHYEGCKNRSLGKEGGYRKCPIWANDTIVTRLSGEEGMTVGQNASACLSFTLY